MFICRLRHWPLLVLLTSFSAGPYYLLGLWFSPAILTEVSPRFSYIFLLLDLLSASLDPPFYGASPSAPKEGTKHLVQTLPGKEDLGELPNRRVKPLHSSKYKQSGSKVRRNKETFL